MMDRIKNLQEKARVFRALLEGYAPDSADAESLLRWLTPLFVDIEARKIIPPEKYIFHMALGKDPDFYECHKDVRSAEADFVCTLEDWESQDWHKKLKSNEP